MPLHSINYVISVSRSLVEYSYRRVTYFTRFAVAGKSLNVSSDWQCLDFATCFRRSAIDSSLRKADARIASFFNLLFFVNLAYNLST